MNDLENWEVLIAAAVDALGGAGPRLMAVVGPNGAGKSYLLQCIAARAHDGPAKPPIIYLDLAGRAARPKGFVAPNDLSTPQITLPGGPETSEERARRRLKATLAQAAGMSAPNLHGALAKYFAEATRDRQDEIERENRQAAAWWRGGKVGPEPQRAPDPAWKFIEIAKDVLGYDLQISPRAEQRPHNGTIETVLSFEIFGHQASVGAFSDGEFQILLLIALLLIAENSSGLILVDEPELFLNERRAVDIWSTIEAAFPHSVFIYATHSLTFATRPEMGALYALERYKKLEAVSAEGTLPDHLMRELVGARVQLLRDERPAVFCEDATQKKLLDPLLGPEVNIVVVGPTGLVRSAVGGEGAWSLLSHGDRRVCGVIDRDTRDDAACSTLADRGVFALPAYDSEAVILLPEVIGPWITQISERPFDQNAYLALLRTRAAQLKYQMRNCYIDQLKYEDGGSLNIEFDFDDAGATQPQITYKPEVEAKLNAWASRLVAALSAGDAEELLTMIKGKALWNAHFPRALHQKFGVHLPPKAGEFLSNMAMDPGLTARLRSHAGLSALRSRVLNRLGLAP
jgi:hypothetical protein